MTFAGEPSTGIEPGDRREEAVEQSEIEDNYAPESAVDEQSRMPAESGSPAANREEATRGDPAAISRDDDIGATEEPDKDRSVLEEQPSKPPDEDEAPAPRDREDLLPDPTLEVPSGREGFFAEQGKAIEKLDSSRNEGEWEQAQQVLRAGEDHTDASADRSPELAERAITIQLEDTDYHRPENQTAAEVVAADSATSTSDDEQPPGPTTVDESDESDVDPSSITQSPRKTRVTKKKPRKYKGLGRVFPQPSDAAPQPGRVDGEEPAQRERSLPIEVRVRFDRGGFCSVSLIARRSTSLPDALTAIAGADEVSLRVMQDEWYQDVFPDNISSILRNGTVWMQEGVNGQCTWTLSGRDLYVLAARPDISGYVSQPCLVLGRDHVVLCTISLKNLVEAAIREAGAQPVTVLDESFGVPPGWLVLRGVVPSAPVSPADDADIFNALRPLPRIEISLEQGIRLGYANWLEGHPPSIRVYGDPEHASEVRIDGLAAERGADASYRAPGWNSIGSHSVWCAGTSRSYSIVPFEASWELWDAYTFPVSLGATQRLAVCGPVVWVLNSEHCGSEALSVPETNPVLLGPEPGQIVIAVRAFPFCGAPCIASSYFRPIWALPRDPLHCDKKTTRILCVARDEALKPKKQQRGGPTDGTDASVAHWCQLILDANRKGMLTDPDTESVRAAWLSYKRIARRIWRSRR